MQRTFKNAWVNPDIYLTTPRLLMAWEGCYAIRYPKPTHYQQRVWVLDYTFGEGGHYCVGDKPVNQQDWQLRKACTAHLYAPGAIYWEDHKSLSMSHMHVAHITFTGGEIVHLERYCKKGFASFLDTGNRVGSLLHRMANLGGQRSEKQVHKATSLFYSLLQALEESCIVFSNHHVLLPEGQTEEHTTPLERVVSYMESHLEQRVSLASVADKIGISTSTLAHARFGEHNDPPMSYWNRLRVEHSKALLMRGWRLKQIAPAVGFCDPYHLSKTFKQYTGMSPSDYMSSIHQATPG